MANFSQQRKKSAEKEKNDLKSKISDKNTQKKIDESNKFLEEYYIKIEELKKKYFTLKENENSIISDKRFFFFQQIVNDNNDKQYKNLIKEYDTKLNYNLSKIESELRENLNILNDFLNENKKKVFEQKKILIINHYKKNSSKFKNKILKILENMEKLNNLISNNQKILGEIEQSISKMGKNEELEKKLVDKEKELSNMRDELNLCKKLLAQERDILNKQNDKKVIINFIEYNLINFSLE